MSDKFEMNIHPTNFVSVPLIHNAHGAPSMTMDCIRYDDHHISITPTSSITDNMSARKTEVCETGSQYSRAEKHAAKIAT